MARIHSTTDYGRFNRLIANRALSPMHVLNIVASLQEKNLLHLNPIIVNKNWELIDGQHRLAAAEKLDIPIYYIQDKDISISDVRLLNTNVKGWRMGDYLETFIAEGLKDYIYTKQFAKKHGTSLSTAMALLSLNPDTNHFGAPYKIFKKGEFVIEDKGLSNDFTEFYKAVSKYTIENTWKDRDFIGALWRVYRLEEINPEDFLSQLAKYEKQIFRSAGIKEYSRQFEDILNYDMRKRDAIRLY